MRPKKRTLARTRGRRRRLEWMALSVLLLALVAWLSLSDSLMRANHLVRDAGLRLAARPAHPDVVIVAIDDRSIAAIGRWPWRRALHAELVARISAAQPLAIGIDVLLGDPDLDYPQDDQLLAAAIARSGRVVLPVMRRGHGPAADATDLPLPLFASAAAGLGHVHVAPGSDGVVRSLYLHEGPAAAPWPHLSLALQCVARSEGAPLRVACNAAPAYRPQAGESAAPWQRLQRTPIAYGGPPSHFAQISYIDVLRGQVPAEALRGKFVLVGAAASGLGDLFATPVGRAGGLMSGVEVVAHLLDAHLSGVKLRHAGPALGLAFNLLPVAGALLALLLLGPLAALLTSVALALATVGLAIALPGWAGLLVAPAAALIGLVLAYPLWSWRRLSAAAYFLRLEMERLQTEGVMVRLGDGPDGSGDFLERRINAVERASRQLRDMHHFVSESLQQLPAPTFVCDARGVILLANLAARQHVIGAADGDAAAATVLQGQSAPALLHDLVDSSTRQRLITAEALQSRSVAQRMEGVDGRGRSLLVQCKPFTDLARAGWLLTLVDLTETRRALLQRDEALHFISHDIRAPNASILTLLEMQRAAPDRIASDELMLRIERYARQSLDMAESFVQLASAQAQEYRREPLDIAALLTETVDDAWALARARDVVAEIGECPETAPAVGDRALLGRALANLLDNAVKFSPAGARVHCSLGRRGAHWVVAVRDQGPGIAPEAQGRLCEPFQRLHERSHPAVGGVGLGLALVHAVVQRHGGTMEVESEVGRGTEFRLVLPALAG